MLDEKGFIQAHLPFDLVSWITDESRQDIQTTVSSRVEEIEKEVEKFKQQLHDELDNNGDDSKTWIRGWKKWEGEWIPRPIGL
jgi:ribosome-associated translation inhibitor RaiA